MREHIEAYRDWDLSSANGSTLSYIVLTVARGVYTLRHGAATSKRKAAAWARQRHPKWSDLIELALRWRVNPPQDARAVDAIRPQVAAFVHDMLGRSETVRG